MKYQVINDKTNKVEEEFYTQEDAMECVDFEFSFATHSIIQVISCRGHHRFGCDEEGHERYDWYGISTGHWCDKCYESNRYPYKKSRYATEEYDGYGERLSDDY